MYRTSLPRKTEAYVAPESEPEVLQFYSPTYDISEDEEEYVRRYVLTSPTPTFSPPSRSMGNGEETTGGWSDQEENVVEYTSPTYASPTSSMIALENYYKERTSDCSSAPSSPTYSWSPRPEEIEEVVEVEEKEWEAQATGGWSDMEQGFECASPGYYSELVEFPSPDVSSPLPMMTVPAAPSTAPPASNQELYGSPMNTSSGYRRRRSPSRSESRRRSPQRHHREDRFPVRRHRHRHSSPRRSDSIRRREDRSERQPSTSSWNSGHAAARYKPYRRDTYLPSSSSGNSSRRTRNSEDRRPRHRDAYKDSGRRASYHPSTSSRRQREEEDRRDRRERRHRDDYMSSRRQNEEERRRDNRRY